MHMGLPRAAHLYSRMHRASRFITGTIPPCYNHTIVYAPRGKKQEPEKKVYIFLRVRVSKKPQTVKTRVKNTQEQKAFSLWEKVAKIFDF